MTFDTIKNDFPLLKVLSPAGHKVSYLDSAATALKPQCVIDAVTKALNSQTANIHRSVHFLGDVATEAYESTRDMVAAFLNAEANEIVFLRNATEGLNLVANCFNYDGKVVSSIAEHHSNFLPWGDNVYRLGVDSTGQIDLHELERVLSKEKVGLVSLSHASNVTGNINDIKAIAELAHAHGAKLLVDAAQSAPHTPIDVYSLDCDFLVLSGHKLGAPTGSGVLFGKAELLEEMDFFLRGGSTVNEVHSDRIISKTAPWKFEAGTPAIESVVGLSAVLEYLMGIGMEDIHRHFVDLSKHTYSELESKLSLSSLIGRKDSERLGPFSVRVDGISPHAIARGMSDRHGICVRSGFHCAQPLHEALNAPASLRLSYWIYNDKAEITRAIDAMLELIEVQQG